MQTVDNSTPPNPSQSHSQGSEGTKEFSKDWNFRHVAEVTLQ